MNEKQWTARNRSNQKKLWVALWLGLLIIVGAMIGLWLYLHRPHTQAPSKNSSPVPASIAQSVNFPIYYPDSKKLPAGYNLDLNSFKSPVKNGVAYSVSYDSNKKIVFSVQQKPSDNELQSFTSNYIPLNNSVQVPVGQAKIGAYNNHGTLETLVSLPTNSKAWIVITAPKDINQTQLKQVLQSLQQ